MMRLLLTIAAAATCALPQALAVAPSDTWRDADIGQSSYLGGGHNMDPAVVDSERFTQLWNASFGAAEKFYAKPLAYTPKSTGKQVVFLASTENIIRTLDAETGELVKERQVADPQPADVSYCTSVADNIGIIGTPTIDPETDIAYFYAKSYIPEFRLENQTTAVLNGVYYFFAVDINTLEDIEGFPIMVDGIPADNDPRKVFIGGTILQRPSLVQIGDTVFAGFGGLCDQFNYTGTILGVNIKSKKVVTNFATQSGPDSSFTLDWTAWHEGGAGGVWQSGMGLSSDGESLFFVTDNGDTSLNHTPPAPGTSQLDLLSESAVKLHVSPDGAVRLADYFQPHDYLEDGGLDLGSGGIALLPPHGFNTAKYPNLAAVAGKTGKIHILAQSDLGGYGNGPDGTDAAVQVIPPQPRPDGGSFSNGIYGAVGAYPLPNDDGEGPGGYIYAAAVAQEVVAYEFKEQGEDDNGEFEFVLAGKSVEKNLDRPGVGIPTITTAVDEETGAEKKDSGIVWLMDPEAGLRAWHAVPGDDGVLKSIELPSIEGTNKYQRPVFGNGRVYVIDARGVLVCLGTVE
ncbi:hypothetical protein AJ80_00612 [Polytolypa hystricis UAMH7299]|uniref:Uncharacterized protein n=1 Tax=Polytolypa hystricis (strain UAMH7299) TaxID=1447883 RepID=A0A2B7Z2X7_POLH7|nr:hypothetical protein AJ80_00612 [Polytolypa hystricis UAMH7299]